MKDKLMAFFRDQDGLTIDLVVRLGLGLEDLEDQILLAHAGGVLDAQIVGIVRQALHGLPLEILDVDPNDTGISEIIVVGERFVIRVLRRTPTAMRIARSVAPPRSSTATIATATLGRRFI